MVRPPSRSRNLAASVVSCAYRSPPTTGSSATVGRAGTGTARSSVTTPIPPLANPLTAHLGNPPARHPHALGGAARTSIVTTPAQRPAGPYSRVGAGRTAPLASGPEASGPEEKLVTISAPP